jgi:3'-phosphoadenosine 5'-phosphosulfate sulfotransferase (PAPS reductase)/FAD synthetase
MRPPYSQEITGLFERMPELMLSVSGGKDSQTMTHYLDRQKLLSQLRKVPAHANVGEKMDWVWSIELCQRDAQKYGLELQVVNHELYLDGLIERRLATVQDDVPPFPSSACRYCTSDAKRGPLNRVVTQMGRLVIVCMGIRAEESSARATKPEWSINRKSGKAFHGLSVQEAVSRFDDLEGRLVLNWYPLIDWTEEMVWNELGHSRQELIERRRLFQEGRSESMQGWIASPAYILGQERHSCAVCIFGSPSDYQVASRYRPDIFLWLKGLENISGKVWRQGINLDDYIQEVSLNLPDWVKVQPYMEALL